jgi:hypothetical protein
MLGKWKKLFKDDIGSCTEAKFIVSDWGDMKYEIAPKML